MSATGWSRLRPRRELRVDLALSGLLGLATFAVHDVGYMFSLPFWVDEAWVAISTKLPLGQLTRVTASTPIGWTFLLRLVVIGGDQRLRIVPLLFAALTVVAAYGYVRSLPWPGRGAARSAAVIAGLVALLIPSALARGDLKQYTADAFVTLMILWMVSRAESGGPGSNSGRFRPARRLLQLAAVVVVGFGFSAVSLFVGVAAFAGLLLSAIGGRRWKDARDAAVVGAATGACLLVVFLIFYRPGIVPGLHDYWAHYYLPLSQGWSESWRFLQTGLQSLAGYLGMGPLLVPGLLFVAGIITLVRMRRAALAIAAPALLLEMVSLSAARQYPLFDLRTSHFLTTALAVTAAIGFGGLCVVLARIHPTVPAGAAVVVLALFLQHVSGGLRAHNINGPATSVEDLRTPADYLATHRRTTDVVVLNALSSWGFAYYWRQDPPQVEPVSSNLQRFVVIFPSRPEILVATDRTPAAVAEVMGRASAAAARIGPSARIWFVHQHTIQAELDDYRSAAIGLHLRDQSVIAGSLELWTPAG
jgi:hypothetical protein